MAKIYHRFLSIQRLLFPIAAFLVLCAISFRFTPKETNWLWNANLIVPLLFVLLAFLFIKIWFLLEKSKNAPTVNTVSAKENIDLLSARELQVFLLIGQGKSNKEICATLFIENSTLKTHINKIYKKLDISDRKMARQYSQRLRNRLPN